MLGVKAPGPESRSLTSVIIDTRRYVRACLCDVSGLRNTMWKHRRQAGHEAKRYLSLATRTLMPARQQFDNYQEIFRRWMVVTRSSSMARHWAYIDKVKQLIYCHAQWFCSISVAPAHGACFIWECDGVLCTDGNGKATPGGYLFYALNI